ncbi:hypothetical protein [Mameliella sp. MMSF_3537]|nr:hypothetical protein [Mameliella sp. MMSF_3537]
MRPTVSYTTSRDMTATQEKCRWTYALVELEIDAVDRVSLPTGRA